jgi:hypothetical protein
MLLCVFHETAFCQWDLAVLVTTHTLAWNCCPNGVGLISSLLYNMIMDRQVFRLYSTWASIQFISIGFFSIERASAYYRDDTRHKLSVLT